MIKTQNIQYKMDLRGYGMYGLYSDFMPGQINCTTTKPGIIRAFHSHVHQTDHWICIKGNIHVILVEQYHNWGLYLNEMKFVAGDGAILINDPANLLDSHIGQVHHHYIGEKNPQMITIPPGVLHGFSPMYGEEATLMYYTDKKYDPDDEYRVPFDFLGKDIWETENK